MTLIYENPHLNDDEPRLHVLVIGCGRFPHLTDNPDRKACADSARKMVEFLLDPASLLTTKVGSIELMLSDPRNARGEDEFANVGEGEARDEGDQSVEPALGATVAGVVKKWANRCVSERKDQLFFYGCSHGVTDRDRTGLMVLEDVNSDDDAEWAQLLNVATMADWIPVKKDPAGSWFFLDACQEVLGDIVDQIQGESGIQPIKARAPDIARFNEKRRPKPVALGVAYGQKTFAPSEGGLAYFTEALLYGLTTSCVEFSQGEYFTVGRKVVEGVEDIAKARFGRSQSTTVFGQDSHQARYQLCQVLNPKVPLRIERRDIGGMRAASNLSLSNGDGFTEQRADGDADEHWSLEVPIAHRRLTLEMTIGTDQISNAMEVNPPAHIHEVY